MHQVVVSPFLDTHVILRPGRANAVKIPPSKYAQLQAATAGEPCPSWFCDAVMGSWGIDVAGRPLRECAVVRAPPPLGYGKASYEVNLGCNFSCKHCFLGLKEFAGLEWSGREKVLDTMRAAGVLWLQLTGGEPLIDRLFSDTYAAAFELGMMMEIITNGSRLSNSSILELLTSRPPNRVTVSVYGATEASYDGLTQRRGGYLSFKRGIRAAREAGIPLDLNLVITKDNAHEVDAMRALADKLGLKYREYANISPTIYGGAESLASQSLPHFVPGKPFTGCPAGHTSFHVDPHGMASICKIGREPNIPLVTEGIAGLHRLGGIADQLLRRQGGCTGCTLSAQCVTCMPLAAKYRQAKAPLGVYCQHTERG